MTVLAFPALSRGPARAEWFLAAATQVHQSPVDASVQTQSLSGVLWGCTLQFTGLNATDARLLWVWLNNMRGRAGRVALWNMGRDRPYGVGGGSPVVAGAGQSGASLAVSGAPPSTTGWLLAGDMLGAGGHLYMASADVNTSAGGTATVPLTFALRAAPADASAITLVRPTTPMRLVDDRQGRVYTSSPLSAYTLDLVEAL